MLQVSSRITGLFLLAILCVTGTFAQEHGKAGIAESFKSYAKHFIATKTVHVTYDDGEDGGWHKLTVVPEADYKLDLRSTDSLLSPYIGTIEYKTARCITAYWKTKAEAQKDTACEGQTIWQHRDTYAFQDGKWTLKSSKFRTPASEEWLGGEVE
jgi:hypothetical protein